jgi:hypothetical protein
MLILRQIHKSQRKALADVSNNAGKISEHDVVQKAPFPPPRHAVDVHHPLVKSRNLPKQSTQDPQPAHSVLNTDVRRRHKSQPQLKVDQPSLRRTRSKVIENSSEEPVVDKSANPDDSRQHSYKFEKKPNNATDIQRRNQNAKEINTQDRPPLVLDKEYSGEEEIYHEQGEADSHGSSDSATTVVFPKVTDDVKNELSKAKDIIENSRTAKEIEDEQFDLSMVSEYGDEIFQYMRELEVCALHPAPNVQGHY